MPVERQKRKKLSIAKAHPPGKPGAPNPEPSSPYLPGKSPHKTAMKGPALPKETSGDKKNYPGSGKKTNSPKLPGERFQVKRKKKKTTRYT